MLNRVQSVLAGCLEKAACAISACEEGTQALADVGPVRERRRVWARRGHAAIEVRGLGEGGRGRTEGRSARVAESVRRALSGVRGVRWAEINAVTQQVLVAFDEGQVDVGQLVELVGKVESEQGTGDAGFSWQTPAHPSDDAPLTANWVAFAADLAGIGAGLVGRLGRIAPVPAAVRVPLTILDGYPRLRRELDKRIGPLGADVLLAVGNATVYGLSDGPVRPAVDATYRLLLAGELQARMAAWAARCEDLTGSADESGARPVSDEGGRPQDLPPGPIEDYVKRTAAGSPVAAAAVLAATRSPGRAAEALNATVPKAAHLGREGFAATLGRDLARRGAVPMDRSVFRRLDRVSAVVIDSSVLIGRRPQVLLTEAESAAGDGDGHGEAQVWQAATAVLHGLSADDLRGPGPWEQGHYRLARRPEDAEGQPDDPGGLRLRVTATGEERRLGEVTVGCEPDPLAEAVLAAARGNGARLHLTRHASLAALIGRADQAVAGDLADHVRALQKDGEAVLLVAAGDNQALSAADVAVGYLRDRAGRPVGWAGDIICGPGLAEVWRLLRAAGRAAAVSKRSVAFAAGGATLGLLEAAVSRRGGAISSISPVPVPRLPVSPVQAMSLTSLAVGAYSARSLAREELPAPVRHISWHAMPVADVVSRLDAERREEADSAADPGSQDPGWLARWRDRVATLTAQPAAGPILGPARKAAQGGSELGRAVLSELRDPLTPVLITGSAASAMLGSPLDAGLVGGVMVGNALVSGAQRLRTERALHHLLLSEQRFARRVPRQPGDPIPEDPGEASTERVLATELRAGDVIVLRPNDVVPADARLLVTDSLEVDESPLTGESLPVAKDAAATVAAHLAERTSMVYDGTAIVSGEAVAIVVAAGEATEAGRAGATAATDAAPAGGVSARLSELTSTALPVTGVGGLAVTALSMLRGVPLREALEAGVAVAVAAVPEGLPLVSTVAQLAAARRLSSGGVLVRSPRALEALGRVDVVCFDKTGTLTEGRLEVAALASASAAGADGEEAADLGRDSEAGRWLLRTAARACPPPDARVTHATDQAILDAAGELDDDGWELVTEVPFQSNRGFSAALGRVGQGLALAVKGAPEVLLDKCARVATGPAAAEGAGAGEGAASRAGGSGEDAVPLDEDRRHAVNAVVKRLAARGLRVLAVAEAGVEAGGTAGPEAGGSADADGVAGLAHDLTLLGFVAIADVMRPDAADVVRQLAQAGVRPVMITGDHPETATAIAAGAAIPDADRTLTGAELDGLAERERLERIAGCNVFARVTPEHKLRIVADLRRAGHVVAMVGDGANDAAAIRLADVGIGVAARGSTAARNSSDLVLTEGDIGQITNAVREGRALWRSVQDAVSILVGGNAGEVTFMVLGTALGGRSPLNTRQLLLVNMLTDMFPALAVAGTRPKGDGDDSAPVSSEPLLTGPLGKGIAIRGGATALGGTLAWAGGRVTGRPRRASTMGLAGVVGTQLAQTMVTGGFSPMLVLTSTASAAVLVAVVETPGISQFFGCTPLGPVGWGIVGASAATATAASIAAPRLLPLLGPGTAETNGKD